MFNAGVFISDHADYLKDLLIQDPCVLADLVLSDPHMTASAVMLIKGETLEELGSKLEYDDED